MGTSEFDTLHTILDDEDTMILELEEDTVPEKDEDDADVENARNQWAAVVHDLMFRK